MKIAAWQMPIGATPASEALAALSVQLRRCEKAGVSGEPKEKPTWTGTITAWSTTPSFSVLISRK